MFEYYYNDNKNNIYATKFMGTGNNINELECDFGLEWLKGNKETGEFYFKDKNGKRILIHVGEYVLLHDNDSITTYDSETFKHNFILNSNSES